MPVSASGRAPGVALLPIVSQSFDSASPFPDTDPTDAPVAALVPAGMDLTALNTLGLRSHARACVTLTQRAQLPALSALCGSVTSLLMLGGGSNLVLPDEVPGLTVQVALKGVRLMQTQDDAWLIDAAAGCGWHGLVSWCVTQGYGGLENLALIPGTVGAAPVQNIGAYGVELAQRLDSVEVWDLDAQRLLRLSAEQCDFAYRDSLFKRTSSQRWLIVSVRLRLPRPWQPVLDYPDLRRTLSASEQAEPTPKVIFDAVCAVRRSKLPDPAVIGNAGSFFKNPLVDAATHARLLQQFPDLVAYAQSCGQYKLAAGWLIDRCGWKGKALGPMAVHDRQALVLVNRGGAQAHDVLHLAATIAADVLRVYGVRLEIEPVVVTGAVASAVAGAAAGPVAGA